jgi:CTP synthase (UTP-ammonia lyase)
MLPFVSTEGTYVIRIGLVGDRDDSVPAHRAIPRALDLCTSHRPLRIELEWLDTDTITLERLHEFDGLWCVPASPYRDTNRAISAIQYARENRIPFLGTCGGFQHALIEYARNVLGMNDAEHAEIHPDAEMRLISPLTCDLVEVTGQVRLMKGSILATAYGSESITVEYHCRYGLNTEFTDQLTSGQFKVSAYDASQAVRAMELGNHPFFVITLFQPERAALDDVSPPIVDLFVKSCVANADEQSDPPKSPIGRKIES